MDLQFTNYFPSETEGAESEDGDISKDSLFSDYFPSEIEDAESEDGDISMDRLFTNYFPSETKGAESEDQGISRSIYLSGTEIPKWFNHQSVEISIFFWVGRKFPKLVVCIPQFYYFSVYMSINGCEKFKILACGSHALVQKDDNYLCLSSPIQWHLQQQLD